MQIIKSTHYLSGVRWLFVLSPMAIGVEMNGHLSTTPMAIDAKTDGHRTKDEIATIWLIFHILYTQKLRNVENQKPKSMQYFAYLCINDSKDCINIHQISIYTNKLNIKM